MPKIHVLSEEVINKIAAGEVIERPASIVKELIENALDAQTTRIVVNIEDSGKKLIKVIDNGIGMDQEDAEKSFLRHSTSKINCSEDLYTIRTLGFRGEALASIAAVSQFSLITKEKGKVEGFNIVAEGGNIISSGILGAEEGTTIEVRNLFFNTPARKKFQKTDAVELRHIIDVVVHYALINYNLSFTLKHEGHTLVNSPTVDNLKDNIASIYGINLAKELLEVNYKDETISVQGYVSKPAQARNDRSQQSIYVNGRWIKSDEISQGVYDAYHSLLFVNKHPIFVLNLEIDPQEIDVNVHPNKLEIKFEEKEMVQKAVTAAIRTTLEKNNLIPEMELGEQLTWSTPPQVVRKEEAKYPLEISTQTILNENSFSREILVDEESCAMPKYETYAQAAEPGVNIKIPPMKLLGQIHKTFFVAETEGGMLLIDQHVVQERVFYEKFIRQYMNQKVTTQALLQGGVLELTSAEKVVVKENQHKLVEFGFEMEEFGENTYILKTIPTIFGRVQPKELFYEVLDALLEGKNRLEEIQEEIITRMACRASVKAGDTLSNLEMEKLLKDLAETKFPYTCPHGRSVLIKVSVDELEKKFRRKG